VSVGSNSNLRIWYETLTLMFPSLVSAGALLRKRETDTVLVAGAVRDLIAVVHATDGSQFTAATFGVVRLEQPGDAADGWYWNETTVAWAAALTVNQVATHLEAGQHLYLLPAAATTGRAGAIIHFTFTDHMTEATATTVCTGGEHLVVTDPLDGPVAHDAQLITTHGAGSWQQVIATGQLNEVPNASSVVTTGTVASGTYASTALLDGVYWQIQDDTGEIEMYFEFLIAADGVPVSVSHEGRLSGAGDDLDVFAYNWLGTAWEQIGTLLGKNSPADEVTSFALFSQHVGAGANLGKVRVRFYTAAGLTTANFYSDQVILSYAVINRSVGYADGAIWVDTANGAAGSTPFINGVADNPVLTWADALLLSAALGIRRFRVAGGSTITLTANSDAFQIIGAEYTLNLGGQSIAAAFIQGATVAGISAGLDARFIGCRIGTTSLTQCGMGGCAITDVITLLSAGPYILDACFSAVAGVGSPVVDFGAAVGDTQLNVRHWSGGIEVRNMNAAGTDTMSLEGEGQLILAASCVGGTIAVRGEFTLTDNAGGAVALSDDARLTRSELADAIWDEPHAGHFAAGTFGSLVRLIRAWLGLSG